MKGDLQERISRACNIAIEADTVNDDDGKYYEQERNAAGQDAVKVVSSHHFVIYRMIGCNVVIDLSQEMIRNAIQQYEMNADRWEKKRAFAADFFCLDRIQ